MHASPLPRRDLPVPGGPRVKDLVDRAPVDVLNSLQPGPALERLAILPLSGVFTVLVGKERKSGAVMATTVPAKGGTGMFSVDKCLEFLDEKGDRERDLLGDFSFGFLGFGTKLKLLD